MKKRIIITYIVLITLIFLFICASVNLATKNYLKYVFSILLYGSFVYMVLILSSIWYTSEYRTNMVLKRKIKKINAHIQDAIEILKSYGKSKSNYKEYNKIRKKVNKTLSKKGINCTFQPIFNEDKQVLELLMLFDKISGDSLSKSYKQYKELFRRQNGLKPLQKFHEQISNEIILSKVKNYIILLNGTIDNNNYEIELLNNYGNNNLYKKYNLFQSIQKRLIIKCVFTTFLLIVLAYGNIVYMRDGYSKAIILYNNKNYEQAITIFENLRFYEDAEEMAKIYAYEYANICYNKEQYCLALYYYNHAWGYKDSVTKAVNLANRFNRLFSMSSSHVVIVKKDGTVVAIGENEYGQCDCDDWKDIVAVSTGTLTHGAYTVGLKRDGTIVTTEKSSHFFNAKYIWDDIIVISTSRYNITGLDRNGNVFTCGGTVNGQYKANDWMEIVAISSDNEDIIGITQDGKCLRTARYTTNETILPDWKNIVAVLCIDNSIIGFKENGTVVKGFDVVDRYMHFWQQPFKESKISCILDGGYLLDKNGNILTSGGGQTEFGQLELSKAMIEFPVIDIVDKS